jgi:cation diffusion facilitator CzcD-associated flavoprotein CzcO
MTRSIDCLVVGAGPAGLATSAALLARGVDHVVFVGRGDAWTVRTADVELHTRSGRGAPPIEPDEADVPVHLDPPTQLQFREHDITSVVWCT